MEETSDINKQVEFFINSFSLENEGDKERAIIIINYIVRQLNNESLKGNLEYHQYRSMVLESVKGLFKLIYIEFMSYKDRKTYMEKLIQADIIFASANNLLQMLFTRVYNGADRDLIIRTIEANRPFYITPNTK
jgi:hypothetical protein